ncbi:MAG: hypothetical protein JW920_07400 [Deltaproteobacteria bacterium]|nr:hypothetical protein [Deltaproteobacteria bacterium]
MTKKKKIGLKYCGGCRAQYNRVAVVKQAQQTLKDLVEFISPESEEAECILVVSGCKTACADITPFAKRPICFIAGEEDAQVWVEEMQQTLSEGT